MIPCAHILTTTYGLFSSEVPVLVYYSHLPSLIVVLLLTALLLFQPRKTLSSVLLIVLNLLFCALIAANLVLWTSSDLALITFLWELTQVIYTAIPVTALFLFYAFSSKEPVPLAYKLVWALPVLAVAALSFSSESIIYADATACEAYITGTIDYIQGATFVSAVVWLVFAAARRIHRIKERAERRKVTLFAIGVAAFLGVFALSWNIASILGLFELEQVGLYGVVAFMAFLTFLIVRYHAFNVGLIAAQALVVGLVVLIGSQFTFVTSLTQQVLIGITLALTGAIGIVLIRSVKREISQREHIEKLAKDLEKANSQQVILIHFITHQIKGFVTKSRNIFSMILEGDFGPLPDTMKPMVEEGLRSDTKGVTTIQEILNAANIKSGKVTYAKEPVDIRGLTTGLMSDLKAAADAKGLAITLTAAEGDYAIEGDRMQLTNAIKNLIDNSIKYTPKGSVDIALGREADKLRMTITDTGVGITPEDMKLLFTEGGHGKESQKVNVESTGFGLYIVKNIIEAHRGRVWAESEGAGKGSRFIIELPVSQLK